MEMLTQDFNEILGFNGGAIGAGSAIFRADYHFCRGELLTSRPRPMNLALAMWDENWDA